MRPVRIYFLTLLLVTLVASCHAAFEYPLLSARELGMGEAVVAYENEISSWNPAHLTTVSGKYVNCSYTDLYGIGIPRIFLSAAMPIGNDYGLGLGISRLWDQETEVTEEMAILSIGTNYSLLNLGVSVRIGKFSFEEVLGKSLGVDFGSAYKINNVNIGCVVRDLFAVTSYNTGRVEKPSRRLVIGVSGESAGINWSMDFDSFEEIRFGMEKWVTSDIAIRAGFNRNKWSFGFTVNSELIGCDYAFIPAQVGPGHLLGISYRW